jgi:hypothetical protein
VCVCGCSGAGPQGRDGIWVCQDNIPRFAASAHVAAPRGGMPCVAMQRGREGKGGVEGWRGGRLAWVWNGTSYVYACVGVRVMIGCACVRMRAHTLQAEACGSRRPAGGRAGGPGGREGLHTTLCTG